MSAMLLQPVREPAPGDGTVTVSARAEATCCTCAGGVAQSSHGSGAAADTNDAAVVPTSAGMLLTNHILQDGEVVLLVLKPSIWFVPLSSLWFIGPVLLGLFAALLLDLPGRGLAYVEAAIFLIAGRLMWAVLQWMGRLYILTDLRILRLSGVFNINIFDCPLRKVARTRVVRSMRERLLRLGTIEITPEDGHGGIGHWHTIARPQEVHEKIVATINRAKQGRTPAYV